MAAGADHEGLAPTFGHELIPGGLRPPRVFEIGEFADVVDIHRAGLLAQLTPSRLKPGDQLFAADGDRARGAIGQDRVLRAPQGDTTEPCDQWLTTFAFDACLKAPAWPVRCCDGGLVAVRHLGHRRVVLAGQRLEHGGLHHPFQPVQSVDVSGGQVVLHQSPVLRPVGPDDRVVVFVDHLVASLGFTELEERAAFGLDHIAGHA